MAEQSDSETILTAEVRMRISKLGRKNQLFFESYARTCRNAKDFEEMLRIAERKAAGASKEAVIREELVRKGVIEAGQYCNASIMLNSSSLLQIEGYSLARIDVSNPGPKRSVEVAYSFDGSVQQSRSFDIPERSSVVIDLSAPHIPGSGKHLLDVRVIDSGAILASASGNITFNNDIPIVLPKCSLVPAETVMSADRDSICVAAIHIGPGKGTVTLLLNDGTSEQVFRTVEACDRAIDVPVTYTRPPKVSGSIDIAVSAVCNGEVLAQATTHISIQTSARTQQETNGKASVRPIERKIDFVPVVDVNEVDKNGNVLLCRVSLRSKSEENVTVQANLSGRVLYKDDFKVGSSWDKICIVTASADLRNEEDVSESLSLTIYDSDGALVTCRNFGITVRSRYDLLNTCKANGKQSDRTRIRWAQFVNPLLPQVRAFVADSEGPLARAMKKDYRVSGYQNPSFVLSQMEAVFLAVRDMGFSYVSTVSTVKAEGGFFQRVRWPDKTLCDRSANCAEFSVLFASIFEAMGLEPLLLFPPGHAMVGVVVDTDAYRSEAKYAGPDSICEFAIDNKKVAAIVFESTLAAHTHATLSDAISSALETLSEKISVEIDGADQVITTWEYINLAEEVIPITYMRQKKNVQPLV